MPTFIKTGYWEKLQKGYKNWLNLDDLVTGLVPASGLTVPQIEAVQSASYPSSTNTFVTRSEIPISVKYFGAVGDGVTDDTVAIQTAVNYVRENGGKLYIPFVSSFYLISSTIEINYDSENQGGLLITGDSPKLYYSTYGGSCIKYTGTAGFAFSINGRGVGIGGANSGSPMSVEFKNISLIGNSTCSGAIYINRAWNVGVSTCSFFGFSLSTGGVITINASGAENPYCGGIIISNSSFSSCGRGILFTGNDNGAINTVQILSCTFLDSIYAIVSDWDVNIPTINGISIIGCQFEGTINNDISTGGYAKNWIIENNYFEQNDSLNNTPRVYISGVQNKCISIKNNIFSKLLSVASIEFIYVVNADVVKITNNFSPYGNEVDRYCLVVDTCTNVQAEIMNSLAATPSYPMLINNTLVKSGYVNDEYSKTLPSNFGGISSGDGWPGGTVCTVASEYSRNNALVRINFNAEITTKSGAGTSILIGLLPFTNTGKDVYFPVYTKNVTGTKPFYGVLPQGQIYATVYDATDVAVNYQTDCNVGSIFHAELNYTTTD